MSSRLVTTRAGQLPAQRLLLGRDDVLLQPVRLRRAACGAPGPGPPLDLDSRLPERVGRGAELVETRQPDAGLPEREDPGPVLDRGGRDFLVEPARERGTDRTRGDGAAPRPCRGSPDGSAPAPRPAARARRWCRSGGPPGRRGSRATRGGRPAPRPAGARRAPARLRSRAASRLSAVPASTRARTAARRASRSVTSASYSADALLEQERGIERGVDVGAELVERDVELRLPIRHGAPPPARAGGRRRRRRRAAAPRRASSASGPWESRGLAMPGMSEGRPGHVALMGGLPVDGELRQPVGRRSRRAGDRWPAAAARAGARAGRSRAPHPAAARRGGCPGRAPVGRASASAAHGETRERGSWPQPCQDEVGKDPTALLEERAPAGVVERRAARTSAGRMANGKISSPIMLATNCSALIRRMLAGLGGLAKLPAEHVERDPAPLGAS